MPRYDYGLRGSRETTNPRFRGGNRPRYGGEYDRPRDFQRVPRVTAPYNMDYVRQQGERYPINPAPYGGEWRGQIGNEGAYRRVYMTRPGTRTSRGAVPPTPYDYRDFGPEYGGRYPDEL